MIRWVMVSTVEGSPEGPACVSGGMRWGGGYLVCVLANFVQLQLGSELCFVLHRLFDREVRGGVECAGPAVLGLGLGEC